MTAKPVDGRPVVFVAGDESLTALREQGTRVDSVEGILTVDHVEAVMEPARAGPCDVVLVTVKSSFTPGAALLLRPVVRPETIVLSLQSGIENDELLAAGIGMPPLMRGVADVAADLVEPGYVRHHSGRRVIFGEPDGHRSERAERLAGLFAAAGIAHEWADNILAAKWKKLAWDAAFNAISTLHQCTIAEMVGDEGLRKRLHATMHEVVAVANASGVALDLAHIDPAIDRSAEELAHLRTPMLQDLERGWRLEVDALNGAVVRAAARVGVDTPVNQLLYTLLQQYDATARDRLPRVGAMR